MVRIVAAAKTARNQPKIQEQINQHKNMEPENMEEFFYELASEEDGLKEVKF